MGCLLAVVRGMWGETLSLFHLPILGADRQGLLPLSPGHGGCGCWGPAPSPQRRLLQAGVARCGMGMRASPGGAPCAFFWGVWDLALGPPRQPVLGAGSRSPSPTCCARGCAGVGTQHSPFGLRALLSIARRGGGKRLPWGGPLFAVAEGVWW